MTSLPYGRGEWAVAILHADAINANRKGRPRDGNESGTDGNRAHKRRKTEQDSVS
jgi:hypothetical protein